jgi:HK97 family phage portal protein
MDELVRAPTGIFARVRAFVERALGVGLPTFAAGGGSVPASPDYPLDQAMAAMSANPWVWACVQAIVTDLCGLPLVAEEGVGLKRTQTLDHWLLALLERPSPKCSGRRFRRQLVTDLIETGNAFVRVWRRADGRPVMLGRIVPSKIKPIVGPDGEVLEWELTGGQKLKWDEVLHIADVSSSQSESLVMGSSAIAPLALGLNVDRDSRRQAGRAARRGRVEMMLTPEGAEVVFSKESLRGIIDQYVGATESGNGIYCVNKAMKATPLTLTARDGEFLGIGDRLRAEVLAVLGVPPVRAGEPAANYGTAKQQMRTYWETLQGRAALIDDELSRLAEPGVRIRHSFANVEALQTSQTERQARALLWMQFGMEPSVAASYEGFVDAPIPAGPLKKPAEAPTPPAKDPDTDEPQEARAAVLGVLRTVGGLYAAGETDADAVETTTRMLLRTVLRHHRAEAVDAVAEEAAAVCRGAAELALQDGDVIGIRAFGDQHAARIVQLARCA